jgi:transposase
MEYGAIDLHARYSEIQIVNAEGAVVLERRIRTEASAFVQVFANRGALRILIEAGTESAWVADTLEAAGHTVIVADPNFLPMYGARSRHVKTNRRDVAALAEANRQGWFKRVHRRSAAQHGVHQEMRVRRALVASRTGLISLVRSLLRHAGYRVPSGPSEALVTRVAQLPLPEALTATVAPLCRVLETLTAEIATLDAQAETRAAADPIVARLQTVPGVGPIVGLTFRAYVDEVTRFASASQVSAAIGLVPREDSSAEYRHRGHITKAGPSELRSLLVQAAWACWRSAKSGGLRLWADGVARRRGRRIAVVALARRLSRILFAVWRDQTVFQAATLTTA